MLKKLVKRFDFGVDSRESFDLSGGLRINPRTFSLEVPQSPQPDSSDIPDTSYSTDALEARTYVTNPLAVKAWLGFAIEYARRPKNPTPGLDTDPFSVQFRLSDGVDDRYWDGANWVVASDPAHWNTEAEVSTNISAFPLANRKLGFVIRAQSLYDSVTPSIRAIKVLYEVDIVESYDILYNSLVPEIKENVRGRSRVAIEQYGDSSIVDLSNLKELGFDTSYDISGVVAAYNDTNDSAHVANLLSSYDENTKVATLSEVVPDGDLLWIEFEYIPLVAVQTSRDYSEVASLPGIQIAEFQELEKLPSARIEDGVLDVTTGLGWKVQGPRIVDIAFKLEVVTDKQSDMHSLSLIHI